ncbi:hypothetical protein [Ornithinimicrobium cavernae]|uniref:hypothetical protein n=1 Tax=Ornithinimicrobium cavernae TaxID=2666047 RepID=UPI000D695B94|nr:hypothetical protein [Ornithinimicrobium cavernae]
MSVATELGLNDPEGELMQLARRGWSRWRVDHPALDVAEDLVDVPARIRSDRELANRVLLALAELAAHDGGNDPAATAALSWLLLPGACTTANRLRRHSDRIDEVVAAQLWIEARTTNWRSGYDVAANVIMNIRKGVLRDLGVPSQDRDRRDRAWAMATLTDELEHVAPHEPSQESATSDFLYDLLAEAVEAGVLGAEDCRCLLDLADAVELAPEARVSRGYAGLLGKSATAAVARSWGVSHSTVSRRARRAVEALRQEYDHKVLSA